ncbi:hypothetical protein BDV29DRAFT_193635 [Aspergillus leporis]|uniref:DUF8213 domain-containing protein n=1 Tax=Aspergillus leporis TaxID=41062 RepID=A0A5N5WR47_9EURO|nr:hypothetical protein BDV29DRAFT_193635 [Aspergillus leporis]
MQALRTILALLPLATMAIPSAPLNKRSITCLKVSVTATAKWTNSAGQSCSFVGVVGSNYGSNLAGDGDYSCNGRCGAGCSGAALGNVYTQECFSHDICSYFNNASGGSSDTNCGSAYDAATDDFLGGLVAGCSQTNPSHAVSKPNSSPTCT